MGGGGGGGGGGGNAVFPNHLIPYCISLLTGCIRDRYIPLHLDDNIVDTRRYATRGV